MRLLKMSKISKAFFGVTVLDQVDFSVEHGEVHALLGENGAGKSTLMKILGGIYTKDDGEVVFDGKDQGRLSIRDIENEGIAFVHQELNIFNDLRVYENMFLGRELRYKTGTLKKREMIKETNRIFCDLGIQIDPMAFGEDLDTSKKQLLEIAKTIYRDAKLFILDEPTTALNNDEIAHLFSIIEHLKKEGKTFIFISHKMPEIFRIADRYTVLRNGKFIHCGKVADVTPEEVTRYMVGESYSDKKIYETRNLGDVVLKLSDYSGTGFSKIDLEVRKGEILGFTGLEGAGCSEVLQTIFGVLKSHSGELMINGVPRRKVGIKRTMEKGVAMVAANRKENSIIPEMSLLENFYLSEHIIHNKNQHIFKKKEIENYNKMVSLLNIKANHYDDKITSLSGGNQQKIILARWLYTEADIILFDNPTQGIDVGAKEEIYRLILELSKEGKTVIVNTLEIPEIQKIADRCIVFYHGRIQTILSREAISEETVMLYATDAVSSKREMEEINCGC